MAKRKEFESGQKVKLIDIKGIPDWAIKQYKLKKGNTYTIREIGEKDFRGDGGGLRLEGINLFSDLTGFEKCFARKRFELVK